MQNINSKSKGRGQTSKQKAQPISTPEAIKLDELSQIRNGRWKKDEHFRFLKALKIHGKEWRRVQDYVKTRTSTQARSHA
jgi:SHAQKYF class myb-like DNA-binding protein